MCEVMDDTYTGGSMQQYYSYRMTTTHSIDYLMDTCSMMLYH